MFFRGMLRRMLLIVIEFSLLSKTPIYCLYTFIFAEVVFITIVLY